MAGLLRRAINAITGAPASAPHTNVRRFDGAVVDRLTASWTATNTAIDQELRTDLDRLRARSRDLFKNNEHGAKFGRMVMNGVVGPEGFTLQARAVGANGALDAADNKAIESAFWRWQRPANCDVTGQRSFVQICRTAARALARDGEFMARRVRGNTAGEFGFQLQLLDINRLDTAYNREPTQGQNAIIMGVEVDQVRRPVAYHLWTSVAVASAHYSRTRERVPASEIIHCFIPIEDEQARGVPWMHAAMRILNDLKGYREAAVIAARIGASQMGVWETPDGGPPPGTDGVEVNGEVITDVSPGQFGYAPPGYKLAKYDPAYPHDQFDAFCKATLRGVSSAIGVAYNGLANDLEGVNFSSIRAGVLDERDEWMSIQRFFIDTFLVPVFEDWLDMSLMRGAIRLPNGTQLPASKRDKFAEHVWQGRRWQWVDPMKDVEAAVIAIDNGLSSPQLVAAQTGRDIEDVLDDLAAFDQMLAARKIRLPSKATAHTSKPEPEPPTD